MGEGKSLVSHDHKKKCISPNLLGAIPESDNAKTFLSNVTAKFKDSDKAETADLMQKFTNMKYEGDGKIREFILSKSNLANKLKTLDVPLPGTFVVHQILNSLPFFFNQLKTTYTPLNDK